MERNEIGLAQQTVERRESEPRFALLLLSAARRATALPINPPPPIKPMVLLQTSEQRARSDGATPNHLPLSRAW